MPGSKREISYSFYLSLLPLLFYFWISLVPIRSILYLAHVHALALNARWQGGVSHDGAPSSSFVPLDYQHDHSLLPTWNWSAPFFSSKIFVAASKRAWPHSSPGISVMVPPYLLSHRYQATKLSGKNITTLWLPRISRFPSSFPAFHSLTTPQEKRKKKGGRKYA